MNAYGCAVQHESVQPCLSRTIKFNALELKRRTLLQVMQQKLSFSHLHKIVPASICLPAFQASSPKTSKPGWFASRAFFLCFADPRIDLAHCIGRDPFPSGAETSLGNGSRVHMADADAAAATEEKTIRLAVAAARQEESGQGIARMPRSAFQALGIIEGDVVEITGKRATAAVGANGPR